jgi:long-chain acyl-CoA synthetase
MKFDLAELASVRTLSGMFAWRVARSPDAEAYRQFDAKEGAWVSTSWAQAGIGVAQWQAALARLQLPRGARVAILLPNGLDAVFIDQAALALALVPVPLHSIDNPGSIAYILADCEASLLLVASGRQWDEISASVSATGAALPALRQVVVTGDCAHAGCGAGGVPVVAVADWLAGAGAGASVEPPSENDLAAIVYSSGTTGKPKGVMLTHANVIANVKATLARVAPESDDVFLSFLPLSHTFERTAGYYLPIAVGCCVAYTRSIAQLGDDLKTVRPTVLISVPRIYERIYGRLQEVLRKSHFKSRLFNWAQAVGWRRFCRVQKLPCEPGVWSLFDPLVWPALQLAVARPLLAQFGGRVFAAVSGGAPLSHAIARCFLGLGLPLLQGYGMTETSPVVAANALDDNDPSTVGRALDGVQVRIGDDLELQVRGPSVMKGYWKRPEDTSRAMTADGWLKSGDQAAIEGGRIRIMGRIKEIIVTSTGEKIAPADLELAITSDHLFEQAFAVGENRPFIAVVVVLNRDEWRKLAAQLNVDPADAQSLLAAPVRAAVQRRIERLTADFPRYAVPRAAWLTLEPWTIENSLITPTLKLKRNNLVARFASEIEALYQARA